MAQGRLKGPFNDKGFTFAVPVEESIDRRDLFVHINSLGDGQRSSIFVKGSLIEYDIVIVMRSGEEKPQAKNVKLLSQRDDSGELISQAGLRGSTKFWHPSGYGFVVDAETGAEYYARSEGVPGGHLRPGDQIEFDVEQNGDRKQAVNITLIGWRQTGDAFVDELDMASPNWASRLAELAEKSEDWNYQIRPSKDAHAILRSYLKYTYLRQRELSEHLVVSADEKSMVFNTGLVTAFQEEIFALFSKPSTSEPGPNWRLRGFEKASSHEVLERFGGALIPLAWYYNRADQLVYDTKLELRVNVEHVPHDPERFPSSLANISPEDLAGLVNAKAPDALKRVRRNYKTAIPQFYRDGQSGVGKMQLLLPIALLRRDTVELALAVDRLDSGVYLGRTVLTLDWAYNNARLITRPDTDWLKP